MMQRLLIHERAYRRIAPALAAHAGELTAVRMEDDGLLRIDGREATPEEAEVELAWANVDAFVSPAVRAFFVAALKSPRLAWMQSGAAGLDSPVFASVVSKGAILTTQHVQAVGIADYVLWGVLDHWQRGPERRAAQAERRWERLPFREVEGKTWLIVGYGAIGQAVAARAKAFGARVIGVRRSAGPQPFADVMISDWRPALPEADVVVLSVPLTASTARMADARAFAAFKSGAVFVNVGRGGLVDEPALLAALNAGTPEHAVLDVFDTEPLPSESSFWSHSRVTATAHLAGVGDGLSARSDRVFLDNLDRYLAGEKLTDAVSAEDVASGA